MLPRLPQIPQHAPQDLPARALGHLVQELDLHDPLVPHLLVLHVLDDPLARRVFVPLRLGVEDDVRLRPLAGPVVRDAEDGHVFDVGVAEE